MSWEELPRIDEHAVVAAAPPDAVWAALLSTLGGSFTDAPARAATRLLGCDPPAASSGWRSGAVGSTIPGFRIVAADRPRLLVVAGRHRFSRYGIVFRIGPAAAGWRLRAESRAQFPGLLGAAYGLAVVGSGGHVVAVRRLLRSIARTAEAAQTPS